MKRYIGNTGVYERLPEPDILIVPEPLHEPGAESDILRKPSGQSGNLGGLEGFLGGLGGNSGGGLGSLLSGLGGNSGGGLGSILGGLGGGLSGILGGLGGRSAEGQRGLLGGLLSRITRPNLELEDIILVALLYLLYRESKDIEFLLIAGAMLFL